MCVFYVRKIILFLEGIYENAMIVACHLVLLGMKFGCQKLGWLHTVVKSCPTTFCWTAVLPSDFGTEIVYGQMHISR